MPYLISYIVAGLLLAVGAAMHMHHRSSPSRYVARFFLIIAIWPLLVLVGAETFFESRNDEKLTQEDTQDSVFCDLQTLSANDLAALSEEERECIERVAKAGQEGSTFFADREDFEDVLGLFWEETIPPEAYHSLRSARSRLTYNYRVREDSGILASVRPPDWYVGFSTEFVKSIAKIDKNKRARLLEAISRLANAPTTPHGNTVKPLTGDMSGLWRYRIGGDRLVYKPNSQSKKVALLSFGARGGIYE